MRSRLILLCLLAPRLLAAAPLPESTPNGILVDRVLPLAHLGELDGTVTAPAVGRARWRQTVHELRHSAATDLGWPEPRAIQAGALARATDNVVPLALVHARYDQLNDDGSTRTREVFTLGALRDAIYTGADVQFRLDPHRMFTHRTAPVESMTLDAGDGRGPRALQPGQALSVSYTETGSRTLTLKATLDDGRDLTASTLVVVKRLATPAPTETWPITATEPFGGAYASGQAYVYLAASHTVLTNPVIVVEGFDLDNTMDWPVLYDLLNQQNLLEDLRATGFDAVVLDFTEATEPIERNAFVLTELLTRVNATIPAGRTSVVIGASMGGLVTRYALSWLEQGGTNHRVRTYLSFDSPHGGANIPLGLQHWLRFFKDESTDADFLLSRLNTPAARQMLLYHQSATSGTSAAPASDRAAWLASLATVGDWPGQPRKVAIANGSGSGQGQGFTTGDQLVLYEYRSLLVDIDGNVWPVPNEGSGVHTIFDGMINLLWPLPDTYETISVGGTQPWDDAPGGYRDSMAQMDATTPTYGDIIALHDNHCFVPTVSALAIDGAAPFHDIVGDPDLLGRTAFDQVYWPSGNQEHIAITAENKLWFLSEIEAGISTVGPVPGVGAATLYPAAPNPFNPRTTIRFRLATSANVSLVVYDLAGRVVRRLLDREDLGTGQHTSSWDGLNEAGLAQASGLYLVQLRTDAAVRTGRLVLLR